MMGLPGAGKTTAAKIIESLTNSVRLSSDEERLKLFPNPQFTEAEHKILYSALDSLTTTLLQEGKSVIYDANLNRLQHRKEKYVLAKNLGATCRLILVQTKKDLAKHRRIEENLVKLVPKNETTEEMFERIANIIELPNKDEPYTELDGTKITPDYTRQKLHLS